MLIYQDVFSGDELASDSFPMKEVDGTILEFRGKHCIRREGEIVLAGANASAEGEDADDGPSDGTEERGIDICLNHRLQNMTQVYGDKKQFASWAKEYMKKLIDHMKKEGKNDDEVEAFKGKIQEYISSLIKKERFKNLDFFVGDGENACDGQLAILEYRDVDGTEVPTLMLIKQGCIEEKC